MGVRFVANEQIIAIGTVTGRPVTHKVLKHDYLSFGGISSSFSFVESKAYYWYEAGGISETFASHAVDEPWKVVYFTSSGEVSSGVYRVRSPYDCFMGKSYLLFRRYRRRV